ncbi:chaperonin: PROVISIONAL [Gigaspora margarita]|uniref:Chaperonin: PROVISIONAL n=1 Tax=Gigaspora margarita TaxID=4874 RepID=A0A8H4A8W6_GIGMA|nr:chaperonin: PROVISIONAL [Gigaspora margarita]
MSLNKNKENIFSLHISLEQLELNDYEDNDNYANVHGYPSPGQHLQHDTQTIIYLPIDKNYTKVYANFIECLNIFPEKLFDKIALQAHIFGICNMEQNLVQQFNYIIAKNEFPQGTSKGANTTINLVYNGLQ